MSFQKSLVVRVMSFSLMLLVFSCLVNTFAQTPGWVTEPPKRPMAVAGSNNLYCAGYIQTSAISTANQLIGGQDEADKNFFAQNDFLYINMGRDKGVNVGDIFSVVRPRASISSGWSHKSNLGFFVQEVGALEVVNVKQDVSVVRVKTSCDNFLLGDLVQLVEKRTSPVYEQRPALDRFGDPSGKAMGRIVMARDGAEMLSRDFIAYVDLGADDNVRVGDRLTVFRPLAGGNITLKHDREAISGRDYGFGSDVYEGGHLSNQATRKTGDKATEQEVRSSDIRNERPGYLRKVVGEAIVLNVKEKTATIVITRTGQEIHTGDWVEIQ